MPLGDIVKSRLKQFSMMNRFKRKALRVGLLLSKYFCIALLFISDMTQVKKKIKVKIADSFSNILFQVIAEFLSAEEVEDIKEMFKKMDAVNDGIVLVNELKAGLLKFGSPLAESDKIR